MDFDTNKITLQYLANDIYSKTPKENKIINHEDVLFYKARLIKIYKLQLKNYKVNKDIDNIFNSYISNLIYYFKIEDRNEEIQNTLNNTIDSIQDIQLHKARKEIEHDISYNIDKLMYKTTKAKADIKHFVINKKKEEIIYPEVKKINIETEYYKRKYNKKNKKIKG